jgi:glycosyltransferase 2 family protein
MRRGRWVVSAAIILLVAYAALHVDWRAAGAELARAALIPIVVAVVINLLSVALRGVRWWIFLRRVGPVPLTLAVRGAIVGSGFNNLLVANGGDATRALLVARATGVARTSVLATLALDRVFDPICFGLLLFVATFVMSLPAQLASARPFAGLALFVVIAILVLLVRAPASDEPTNEEGGWRARVREFRREVETLSTSRRFIAAMLVSASVWALQVVVFALVARSVGIALPLAGTVAAMLLTNTGLILRATPGNVGYFQFAYAIAAGHFGVPADAAVASALLLQVVQIVPVTLLALALAPRMMKRTSGAR